MAFVYRLQTSEGIGPYSSGEVRWFFINRGWAEGSETIPYYVHHSIDDWHPSPWEDGITRHGNKDYYCGFESFEKFCDWFLYNPNVDTLAHEAELLAGHEDLNLHIFEVAEAHIMRGRRQAMFDLTRAKPSGMLTMHEVAELVR